MLNGMTYNELAHQCHSNNAKWWHDLNTGERLDRNKGELLMLMVSEISEAMEGLRKNLMDDKLPHRKMVEVELADAVIRIGDFAGGFNYDIDAAAERLGEFPEDEIGDFPENRSEGLLWIVSIITKIYETILFQDDVDVAEGLYVLLKTIELYAKIDGYDLDGAYTEKRAFNAVRVDHTAAHRLGENGKKF